MRSTHLVVVDLVLLTAVACSSDPRVPGSTEPGADAGAQPPPLGADTRGQACIAGCGADDNRLCSAQSEVCALCLVDPAHVQITYCSQDCTSQPCPEGWTCQPVKAFGQDQVEQACVAQPASCGDGVTQLGEVCDGDDPQLGRCVDCMTWAAVCGDGVVQAGEVCDGDNPEFGRCVECASWQAVCGDGFIQPPEVCDGNADGQFCVECGALEAPRMELNIREMNASAVERIEGNSTWYYGLGMESGSVTVDVPTAGAPDGCGGLEVLEASAALTRVAWTLCSEWGISTWRFALPRTEVSHAAIDGPIPPEFAASVRVQARDGSYDLEWTMSHVQRFDVGAFLTEPPGWSQGNFQFWMQQADPLASFNQAEARIDINFRFLHPVL